MVLQFEHHRELQTEGVGCPGQQGRYAGKSTDANIFTKSAAPSSALTLSSVFFSWAQRTQRVPMWANPLASLYPGRAQVPFRSLASPHGIPRWGEERCPAKKPSTLPLGPGDRRSLEWKSYVHLPSQGVEAPWGFARCLRKRKLSSFCLSTPLVRGALQLKTRWRFVPGEERWSGGWGNRPCSITDGLSTVITKSWS